MKTRFCKKAVKVSFVFSGPEKFKFHFFHPPDKDLSGEEYCILHAHKHGNKKNHAHCAKHTFNDDTTREQMKQNIFEERKYPAYTILHAKNARKTKTLPTSFIFD